MLEQRTELLLERGGLGLEASPVAALLEAAPGGEEVVCDLEAVVAELFLLGHAFTVGGEVSEQVGPAELPLAGLSALSGPEHGLARVTAQAIISAG